MPELDTTPKKDTVKRRPPKKRKKMSAAEAFISGIIPWKGDTVGEAVRKIVLLVSIIVLFVAGFIMLDFYVMRDRRNTEEALSYAQEREKNVRNAASDHVMVLLEDDDDDNGSGEPKEKKEVEVLAEYLPFYEQNNDFVGWIELYPYIQMPVVQYTDNNYYLKHTFDKGPNENGTIFADYQGKITADEMPGNLLLYGHNLITNNYFQPLSHYRKEGMEFLQRNYLIKFDTLYNRNNYFVFAVFLTNTNSQHGEVFDYWNTVYFKTKSEFDSYIAECLDRSYFYTGVDLEYGDEILTLSTCDFSMFNDMRLVVMARKVRPDESTELDTSKFIDNSGFDENGNVKRKMFDAYYKNYACEWAGRKWDTSFIKDFKEE